MLAKNHAEWFFSDVNGDLNAVTILGIDYKKVCLTELETALNMPQRKGAHLPHNTALDEAEHIVRTVRTLRQQLDRESRRRRRENREWVPDKEHAESVAKIATAFKQVSDAWNVLRKIRQEEREGYTDEELHQVWIGQLARAAQTMPDDEWRIMTDIRFGTEVSDVLLPGRKPGFVVGERKRGRPPKQVEP